jgi:accessory colonization factor AcfC
MFRSMLAAALLALPMTAKAETVRLYAAGSLKAALTDVARAFEANSDGLKVEMEFAASGLLRERIEQGAKVDVFASAGPSLQAGRCRLRQEQDRYLCAQRAMRPGAQRSQDLSAWPA